MLQLLLVLCKSDFFIGWAHPSNAFSCSWSGCYPEQEDCGSTHCTFQHQCSLSTGMHPVLSLSLLHIQWSHLMSYSLIEYPTFFHVSLKSKAIFYVSLYRLMSYVILTLIASYCHRTLFRNCFFTT